MTVWDMVRALLRRWPIVLIGLLVTGGVAFLAIRTPGVYFTRMQIVFLGPSTWYPNVLQASPEGVVVTASAVAKRIVGPDRTIKYGSLDATSIGTPGPREGAWIRPEDQGGQWAPALDAPVILVDVVASSVERVRQIQQESARRAQDELDKLQNEHPGTKSLITLETVPDESIVYYVRGNRPRALAMTSLLGGLLTLSAVWLLELRSRRREDGAR